MQQKTIPYPNMVGIVDSVTFSSLAGLPAAHLPAYILTSGPDCEIEAVLQRWNISHSSRTFSFESVCGRTFFFRFFLEI